MLRLFAMVHLDQHGTYTHQPGHVKALYLAPNRALVQVDHAGACLHNDCLLNDCYIGACLHNDLPAQWMLYDSYSVK